MNSARRFSRCEREGPGQVLGCVKLAEEMEMSHYCTGRAEETLESRSLGGKRNHKQV